MSEKDKLILKNNPDCKCNECKCEVKEETLLTKLINFISYISYEKEKCVYFTYHKILMEKIDFSMTDIL